MLRAAQPLRFVMLVVLAVPGCFVLVDLPAEREEPFAGAGAGGDGEGAGGNATSAFGGRAGSGGGDVGGNGAATGGRPHTGGSASGGAPATGGGTGGVSSSGGTQPGGAAGIGGGSAGVPGTAGDGGANTGGTASGGVSSGGTGGTPACTVPCDCDEDGYVAEVCAGNDCDDTDGDVHPDQTVFFGTEANGGGYDYDCSEAEEREQPTAIDCGLLVTSQACANAPIGFLAPLPACGTEGAWGTCVPVTLILCQPDAISTELMKCR